MKDKLADIINQIKSDSDALKASAIILYRLNKSIKYVRKENPGLAKRVYRLKEAYVQYYVDLGFRKELTEGMERDTLMFDVCGVTLKFHMRGGKHGLVDIENKPIENDGSVEWIKELEPMYKILVAIGKTLKIDESSRKILAS